MGATKPVNSLPTVLVKPNSIQKMMQTPIVILALATVLMGIGSADFPEMPSIPGMPDLPDIGNIPNMTESGDSDKFMDPCYILAKYTNQLGEGKLKWDDEKDKLVCFDDGSEPEKYSCNLETESPNIDYTCGSDSGTGSDSGAPNMLLLGIALSFAARFIAL